MPLDDFEVHGDSFQGGNMDLSEASSTPSTRSDYFDIIDASLISDIAMNSMLQTPVKETEISSISPIKVIQLQVMFTHNCQGNTITSNTPTSC